MTRRRSKRRAFDRAVRKRGKINVRKIYDNPLILGDVGIDLEPDTLVASFLEPHLEWGRKKLTVDLTFLRKDPRSPFYDIHAIEEKEGVFGYSRGYEQVENARKFFFRYWEKWLIDIMQGDPESDVFRRCESYRINPERLDLSSNYRVHVQTALIRNVFDVQQQPRFEIVGSVDRWRLGSIYRAFPDFRYRKTG